jgi:hypothetical protein
MQMHPFHNKASFYGEELLAPRPTPKLEDHPLSPVRDCLFNTFAAALHIGGRSSIRNLKMHRVDRDPLIMAASYRNLFSKGYLKKEISSKETYALVFFKWQ